LLIAVEFCSAAYNALQDSGPLQATVGKLIVGVKVCDQYGNRLQFGHALLRWLLRELSAFLFYVGHLPVLVRPYRTVHDRLSGTQVVDRWAYTQQPERQRESASWPVTIVGCVLIFVLFLLPQLRNIKRRYELRQDIASMLQTMTAATEVIDHYVADNGRCPKNWAELGVEPPRHQLIKEVRLGYGRDDGPPTCDLHADIKVDDRFGYNNHRIAPSVFMMRRSAGDWMCDSTIDGKWLVPDSCIQDPMNMKLSNHGD
jgi:hypothetical protein